jgi:thiol:disulfide interchange protein DsbC
MFPRAGLGSPSYDKAVSVWCADDRQAALTDAKAGKPVEARQCDNPVIDHYRLGQEMGVRGTPSIFYSDGSRVPGGYLPPDRLEAVLTQMMGQ